MNSYEFFPFNLALESQEQTFQERIDNSEMVNQTVQWYLDKLHRMRDEGISTRDFGDVTNIAQHEYFPGNLFPNDFTRALRSRQLAEKVTNLINSNPSVCINTPTVLSEKYIRLDDECELSFSRFEDSDESQTSSNSTTAAPDHQNQADVLRKRLHLNRDEVDHGQLVEISRIMREAEGQLKEAMYLRFVIDQAVVSIKQLAPDLTEHIEQAGTAPHFLYQ